MAKLKRKKQPFDVTAPSFDTRKQFNRALKRRTNQQIKPPIRQLRRERQQEQQASRGRIQDIKQYSNFYDDQLKQAFNRASSSLNNLIAERSAGSAQAQAALMAALNTAREGDRSLAQTVGGMLPDSEIPGTGLSTFASQEALQNKLAAEAGSLLSGSAARRDIAGLERVRSIEDEGARARALFQDIAQRIADVKAARPEVREQMRKQLLDEELAKRGQSFQERIANQELKLSKRQQDLAEQQADRQWQLDLATLDLQRDQLKAQVKQAIQDAGISKGDGDKLITKFQVARTQLEKFVEPFADRKKRMTDKDAKHLFTMLTGNYNIPDKMALKVMIGSGHPALANWARQQKKAKNLDWTDILKDAGQGGLITLLAGWQNIFGGGGGGSGGRGASGVGDRYPVP